MPGVNMRSIHDHHSVQLLLFENFMPYRYTNYPLWYIIIFPFQHHITNFIRKKMPRISFITKKKKKSIVHTIFYDQIIINCVMHMRRHMHTICFICNYKFGITLYIYINNLCQMYRVHPYYKII